MYRLTASILPRRLSIALFAALAAALVANETRPAAVQAVAYEAAETSHYNGLLLVRAVDAAGAVLERASLLVPAAPDRR